MHFRNIRIISISILIIIILISSAINYNIFYLSNNSDKIEIETEGDWLENNLDPRQSIKNTRYSVRDSWVDTFDNELNIDSKSNLLVSNGDVTLQTSSFLITTTNDFDTGTKSSSSNNFEIETVTDNPAIPSDQFELGSKYGDNFNFADNDGKTWKWLDSTDIWAPSGTYSKDIDTTANDKLHLEAGSPTTLGVIGVGLDDKLTGDFSVQAKHSAISWTSGSYAQSGMLFFIDTDNWIRICVISTASGDWVEAITRIDGVSDQDFFGSSDRSVSFRIRRSGSTVYCDYDMAQGNSFTNLKTTTSSFLNKDGDVQLILRKTINNGLLQTNWFDFKVNSGTFLNDGYRTSGNWLSQTQTMPVNSYLKDTTITFSGLTPSVSKIDKIEWLINDIVKAAYETDIQNNGLSPITINDNDLTFGSFKDVNSDFAIKIYLTGDGTAGAAVEQIEGTTISVEGTLISAPITIPANNVWDTLTIDKTEPGNTYLNITAIDGDTNQPISGYTELTGTSADLSQISPIDHPKLKLLADFSTLGFTSPSLHEWAVSWVSDPPELTMDIPSTWAFPEDTDADDLIDLADYFEDGWTSDNNLKFQIIHESDDAHIDAIVDGKLLDFSTPTINWSGSETFKVKCTDEGGLTVNSNEFKVTVTEINDPPAWTPIGFVHIEEDSVHNNILDIDEYIADVDDVLENITYVITANNNPGNVYVQIEDRHIFAEPILENYYGDAIIKVRANDGAATANISFVIIVDPLNDLPIVELLSPTNNAIITTSTVKLTWSEGFDLDSTIASYDVYLDDISPPQTLVSNDQTVTSFSRNIEDGTYYWTVIPYDGIDVGLMDPDKIWAFTVNTYDEPSTPPPTITLASPYNYTIINSKSIELFWNDNESFQDLKYFVYFDTEPKPNKIVASELSTTSYFQINLTDGVTYYWTVIPVAGSLMGACEDGIWSFTVQLDFIPVYYVELNGVKNLNMNQSETRFCNLTVNNEGNVRDIYSPELEAGVLSRDVKFHNLRNIILDPGQSKLLTILISLPEDAATGFHNITVTISSFWGGKTINDTHQIQLKVEPKALPPVEPVTEEDSGYDIIIWIVLLIIILIILIAIAAVLRKRKEKLEKALATEGITKPTATGKVLLPDIVSKPTNVPRLGTVGSAGRTVPATPVLQSVVSPTTVPQTTIPRISRVAATPQLPQVTQIGIAPVPAPVRPSPPPPPPSKGPAQPEKEMSIDAKLKLLNERLLKGEIDQELYKKLRAEFEIKSRPSIPPTQPKLPPAIPPQPTTPQTIVPTSLTAPKPQNNCPKCGSVLIGRVDGSKGCIKCGYNSTS